MKLKEGDSSKMEVTARLEASQYKTECKICAGPKYDIIKNDEDVVYGKLDCGPNDEFSRRQFTGSSKNIISGDVEYDVNERGVHQAHIICRDRVNSNTRDYIIDVIVKSITLDLDAPAAGEDSDDDAVSLPLSPENVMASAIPAWTIIDWNKNSLSNDEEDGFKVYRGTASGGPYTSIADVDSSVFQYLDTSGASGVTYYYVVRSYNAAGESEDSLEVSATRP